MVLERRTTASLKNGLSDTSTPYSSATFCVGTQEQQAHQQQGPAHLEGCGVQKRAFVWVAVQTAAVNRKKGATGGRTRPTTSTAAFAAPTTSTTSTTRPTTSIAASAAPTHLHGLRARPVLYVEELREVGEQVVRHRCQHDRERAERGEREDRAVEAHCVSAKRPGSERASHHQLLC